MLRRHYQRIRVNAVYRNVDIHSPESVISTGLLSSIWILRWEIFRSAVKIAYIKIRILALDNSNVFSYNHFENNKG